MIFFLELGFTPIKAEQLLQSMELNKNKKDKDKKYAWKLIKKNLKIKGGY